MSKISAVIISKNSQDLIGDCIRNVSFCDEIIVVDSKSIDETVKIAHSLNAKIIEYNGNDFSQMRDLGLKSSTSDWVLYVDTDERLTEELKKNVKEKVLDSGEFVAFKIKRKNYYFGKHEWPHIEKLERLFKRNFLRGWYGKIHESPQVLGKVGELEGFLLHYTHKNLSSMVNKTIEWSKIEAELRFKANHPKMTLWRFPRVMLSAFFDSYIRQKGFKAGVAGLIESTYQSFSIFLTYARLWGMQRKNEIN